MLPSPRSAPCCHRFGQVQASPALCPCEPRRPRVVKQAVAHDARSDTRPSALNLDLVRSALSGSEIRDWIFIFSPLHMDHVRQKKHQPTQSISCVPGRAPADAARDGRIHPLCIPAPVPTAKSGVETPQRVSGTGAQNYYNADDDDYYSILQPTSTTFYLGYTDNNSTLSRTINISCTKLELVALLLIALLFSYVCMLHYLQYVPKLHSMRFLIVRSTCKIQIMADPPLWRRGQS